MSKADVRTQRNEVSNSLVSNTTVAFSIPRMTGGLEPPTSFSRQLTSSPVQSHTLAPSAAADGSLCEPGFESELFILKVSRKNLKPGTRLCKVGFTDCTTRTRFLFSTDDSRLVVEAEGIITVKRQIVLHEGNQNFLVHAWDSQGQKMTLPFRLLYQNHHYMNNRLDAEFHHEAHKLNNQLHDHLDSDSNQQIPILDFPKSNPGLKRRKRDWVIPPLSVPEHSRGPYPRLLAKIRSNKDKVKKIYYSITGPGADQPPVGLFTMNRDTGHLYVTQELDREKVDKYTLQVHSVAEGGDGKAEEPMDIIINVIDQNDNKPVYSQSIYMGDAPEASQKGFQVLQVVATDADQPNTDNSDIRYRIMSQKPEEPNPNMFIINPTTGVIRVNEPGLDREKVPKYELEVQVADMKGEGLTGFTKVIIKVTDLNDYAPVFLEPRYNATVEENKVDTLIVKMLVTDTNNLLVCYHHNHHLATEAPGRQTPWTPTEQPYPRQRRAVRPKRHRHQTSL
ncbi:hypothetical protein CCH79_00018827 [Gambusia affinis]|uniref:Cadherin domain-containing protein n=1 Tax=Gambusia affinis TaxID=33528 RepID=A0A315VP75_GAMAF|nr:hypothetical protein CCH79_00018827 [Gambusia affinis]